LDSGDTYELTYTYQMTSNPDRYVFSSNTTNYDGYELIYDINSGGVSTSMLFIINGSYPSPLFNEVEISVVSAINYSPPSTAVDGGTVENEVCFNNNDILSDADETTLLSYLTSSNEIFWTDFSPVETVWTSVIVNTLFQDGTIATFEHPRFGTEIRLNTALNKIEIWYNDDYQLSDTDQTYCLSEVSGFVPMVTTPASITDLDNITDDGTSFETPFYSYYDSVYIDYLDVTMEGRRNLQFEMDNDKTLDTDLFTIEKYDLQMDLITTYDGNFWISMDFVDTPIDGTRTQIIGYEVLAPSLTEFIYISVVKYDGEIVNVQYVSLIPDDLHDENAYIHTDTIEGTFTEFTTSPHENIDYLSDTSSDHPFMLMTYDELSSGSNDLLLYANTVRESNPMLIYNIDTLDNRNLTYQDVPNRALPELRNYNDFYAFINTLNNQDLPSIDYLENNDFYNDDLDDVLNAYNTIQSNIETEGYTSEATYLFSLWRDGTPPTNTAEALTYTFISNTEDKAFMSLTLPKDEFLKGRDYTIQYYIEPTLYAFQDNVSYQDMNTSLMVPLEGAHGSFTITIVQNLAQDGDNVTIKLVGTTASIPLFAEDNIPIEQGDTYIFKLPPTLDQRMDDITGTLGLSNTLGRMLLSVIVIVASIIGLVILKLPMYAILIVTLAEVVLFAFIGFIPLWLILAFALLVALGVFFTMKGGGQRE